MTPTDTLSADLEATLERCASHVRMVAIRYGLAEADIDEVFQEVRIRLWRALDSGEKIATVPASYVYKAATSSALDIIRRRRARREETLDSTMEAGTSGPSLHASPEDELARGEAMQSVRDAVEALIESRRPVVRMHLAGYKLDEIAGLLGWTPAKTRNLLYRGMNDLRETLASLGVRPGELR